ncbi:6-carboxytetrahydropterin synthase [Engelhardtia mirabilis]|uniref:6-carboxytetrahydropterin synthase n=1 Tax=Engelhardtia mirabilis TaxID=2528011 RepID=UPI003AF3E709
MTNPEVELIHRTRFSAAHRLENRSLSEAENRSLYGPCYGDHGHDFHLEVCVRGSVDPRSGMVVDLVDLMRVVRERVYEPCDHKHLNRDVPFLEGTITTVENVALALWAELAEGLAGLGSARLTRLRLWEGPDCAVELDAERGTAP